MNLDFIDTMTAVYQMATLSGIVFNYATKVSHLVATGAKKENVYSEVHGLI
jgi:hypothetical protein